MLLIPLRTIVVPRMPFTFEELAILDGPTASPFVRFFAFPILASHLTVSLIFQRSHQPAGPLMHCMATHRLWNQSEEHSDVGPNPVSDFFLVVGTYISSPATAFLLSCYLCTYNFQTL